jgi:hypothetical protein
MVNDKEITKAFSSFHSAVKRAAATKSQISNPCELWKKLQKTWDAVIQALKALGTLIPIARQAADAMEKVRDILNALCA